jgi:hypothetical protein
MDEVEGLLGWANDRDPKTLIGDSQANLVVAVVGEVRMILAHPDTP